jgi:hypothetical protein
MPTISSMELVGRELKKWDSMGFEPQSSKSPESSDSELFSDEGCFDPSGSDIQSETIKRFVFAEYIETKSIIHLWVRFSI